MNTENKISTSKNTLLVLSNPEDKTSDEFQYLLDNFCGQVVRAFSEIQKPLRDKKIIALFSCYEQADDLSENALRKLKLKCKKTEEEFEILLEHNSVILFSLATNTKFLHKIVLDTIGRQKSSESDNKWLGITFRQSKTLIQFRENLPCFANGQLLKLADETQQKEFYQLRGQENRNMDFVYPEIAYTLSVSDTMLPTNRRRI